MTNTTWVPMSVQKKEQLLHFAQKSVPKALNTLPKTDMAPEKSLSKMKVILVLTSVYGVCDLLSANSF